MESLELNKACAAVLVAGITFMVTGLIAETLVHPHPLKEMAIKVEGLPAAGGGPAPAEAPLEPISPLLATADVDAGAATFKKQCSACHTPLEGGKDGVGPNLYGIVGAPHGHAPGFNYSPGLKGIEGPWNYEELNAWLHKPSSVVKGTRMAFAGISSAKQRAEVIAYLRSLSKSPAPLPTP